MRDILGSEIKSQHWTLICEIRIYYLMMFQNNNKDIRYRKKIKKRKEEIGSYQVDTCK